MSRDPTQGPWVTSSGPSQGGTGASVILWLPSVQLHARQCLADSVLSLYRLAVREGRGVAQGHTANQWQNGD